MCAPHELTMQTPAFYRSASASNDGGGDSVGDDFSVVSPLGSPRPSYEQKTAAQAWPLVKARDSKQWVDLDFISPKLLGELTRRSDTSSVEESVGPLGRRVAKVKAWARQNKSGIEIRLRRKINAERDEVTEIRLVPDSYAFRDDKPTLPAVSELPGTQNEVYEMPDSSFPVELDAAPLAPARNSVDGTFGEPPPRYEPSREKRPSAIEDNLWNAGLGPLSYDSSDIASRSDPPSLFADRSDVNAGQISESNIRNSLTGFAEGPTRADAERPETETAQKNLEDREGELRAATQLSRELQRLIGALKTRDPADENVDSRGKNPQKDVLGGLKVTGTTTYETETDYEPPSPSERSVPRKPKGLTSPRRTKNAIKIKKGSAAPVFKNEPDTKPSSTLFRQQTLPKPLPEGSGPESIWASLLRAQALILGPEHPLVYQARSDLARSRATGRYSAHLDALQQSQRLASEQLGTLHPRVAAFSEDLEMLEKAAGARRKGRASDVAQTEDGDGVAGEEIAALTEDQTPVVSARDGHRDSLPKIITTSELLDKRPPGSAGNATPRSADGQHDQRSEAKGTPSPQPTAADVQTPAPQIVTTFHPTDANAPPSTTLWNSWERPHAPRNNAVALGRLVFGAVTQVLTESLVWLQRNYGPENPVEAGKVRVRWMCSCGEHLYDDYVERRPGAARELEAYLNRPRTHTGGHTPTSPSSGHSPSHSLYGSSIGGPTSAQTSWSSYGFPTSTSGGNDGTKLETSGQGWGMPYSSLQAPSWLLTCANEDRYTPKVAHLDMTPHRIRSDKDLALSLREHYFHVNKRWYRTLKLRGLTTIEFVQFEVHQNRFADIRKCPDVPPTEANGEYLFEPGDLLPPVGSQYLLHLFRHPEDYDGELITYLRAPKRNARLQLGVGWGINLVEGFRADRVWMLVSMLFAAGSVVFGVVWAWKRHDVQGAFGVAAWMVALACLAVGWLQACLG